MAQIGYMAARILVNLLRSSTGLANAVTEISQREEIQLSMISGDQIYAQNIASEVAEKGKTFRYPALYVYCDKVQNPLREKFRMFSGTARLNIEVRTSRESLEGLEQILHSYVDAITEVLIQSRGDWGHGVSYSGEYEVQFSGAKIGAMNYVQTAKVILDVAVSQG